jgi:hypothetical protein
LLVCAITLKFKTENIGRDKTFRTKDKTLFLNEKKYYPVLPSFDLKIKIGSFDKRKFVKRQTFTKLHQKILHGNISVT